MKTVKQLELSDAQAVIEAAKAEATNNRWSVSVAVVDAGGHLLAFERMDGVAPSTSRIAREKARTSATFRAPTAALEDKIADRAAMLVLPGAAPLKGGVPLVADGNVVGAVGVSGLAPQQDHQVAEAAAARLNN
ncbi:MAG: heme-binding protein [Rhodobacteraceae bacterium]|nr:heme-binding protein [Paracoccaceae bacterium]